MDTNNNKIFVLSSGEWAAEEALVKYLCRFIQTTTKRNEINVEITRNITNLVIKTDLGREEIEKSNAYTTLNGIAEIIFTQDDTVYFKSERPNSWPWYHVFWSTMPLEIWSLLLICDLISMIYYWPLVDLTIVTLLGYLTPIMDNSRMYFSSNLPN